jgi:hypothetical protein
MNLDVKEVIQIARTQFKELLPELALESADIRLEEIQREGANWAVTFSVPNPSRSTEDLLLGIRNARMMARIGKIIVVDGSDGQLVALRQLAA